MWIDYRMKRMKHIECTTSDQVFDELERLIPLLKINREGSNCNPTWLGNNGNSIRIREDGFLSINWNTMFTKIKIKTEYKNNITDTILMPGSPNISLSKSSYILEINFNIDDINFYQWESKPLLNNAINFTLSQPLSSEGQFNQKSDEAVWSRFFDDWKVLNTNIGMIKYPSFKIGNNNINLLCDGDKSAVNRKDFLVENGQNYSGLAGDRKINLQNFGMADKNTKIILYDDSNYWAGTHNTEIQIKICDNTVIFNNKSYTFSKKPNVIIYRRTCPINNYLITQNNTTTWLDYKQNAVSPSNYMYMFSPYKWIMEDHGYGAAWFPDFKPDTNFSCYIKPRLYKTVLKEGVQYTINTEQNTSPENESIAFLFPEGWKNYSISNKKYSLDMPYTFAEENITLKEDPWAPGNENYYYSNYNGFSVYYRGSFKGYLGTSAYSDFNNFLKWQKPTTEPNRKININIQADIPVFNSNYNIVTPDFILDNNSLRKRARLDALIASGWFGKDEIISMSIDNYWSLKNLKGTCPWALNFIKENEELSKNDWGSKIKPDWGQEGPVALYQKIGIESIDNSAYVLMISFDEEQPSYIDFVNKTFYSKNITIARLYNIKSINYLRADGTSTGFFTRSSSEAYYDGAYQIHWVEDEISEYLYLGESTSTSQNVVNIRKDSIIEYSEELIPLNIPISFSSDYEVKSNYNSIYGFNTYDNHFKIAGCHAQRIVMPKIMADTVLYAEHNPGIVNNFEAKPIILEIQHKNGNKQIVTITREQTYTVSKDVASIVILPVDKPVTINFKFDSGFRDVQTGIYDKNQKRLVDCYVGKIFATVKSGDILYIKGADAIKLNGTICKPNTTYVIPYGIMEIIISN